MEVFITSLIKGFADFGAIGVMLALLLIAIWWTVKGLTSWAAPHADRLINKWEAHVDAVAESNAHNALLLKEILVNQAHVLDLLRLLVSRSNELEKEV